MKSKQCCIGLRLIIIGGLALLSSCVGNHQYRTDYTLCNLNSPTSCQSSALQRYQKSDGDYYLGFIEYDDQGQQRDPRQVQKVLNTYREIAGNEDVLLISFVHGWHHSAKPSDANIVSFRNSLAEISAMETVAAKQQARPKRQVLGLYVGWRGDALRIPYIKNISFWDRKATAHTVGQQGVTDVLLKMEEIVNVRRSYETEVPRPIYSRLVVLGHSFGGAVVYSALQKILADRFINSEAGKAYSGDAQGFGDLVVLINPAFEALRFTSLFDLAQENCRVYFANQLPKLVVLTSESDLATKWAFPAGRAVSSLAFESHNTIDRNHCRGSGSANSETFALSEYRADITALGHFSGYQTHRLNPAAMEPDWLDGYRVKAVQNAWSNQVQGASLQFSGSVLESRNITTARNPYLNIQVDRRLIQNHNDIWGEEIRRFIEELIVISATPATDD